MVDMVLLGRTAEAGVHGTRRPAVQLRPTISIDARYSDDDLPNRLLAQTRQSKRSLLTGSEGSTSFTHSLPAANFILLKIG
jgi:hypothetical protein